MQSQSGGSDGHKSETRDGETVRQLRCEKCIAPRQAGTRTIYPRSAIGEPAEFERVLIGRAKVPQLNQRWMELNGERQSLPTEYYNCDGCGAEIKPGELCGTWSVWTEDMQPVPAWESSYLETDGERPDSAPSPTDGGVANAE